MIHSKRLGKKINTLHEKALRFTYGDKNFSLNELMEKHKSVCTKVYKIPNNMSPKILVDIFRLRATANVGDPVSLKMGKVQWYHNPAMHIEIVSHIGLKFCSL